MPAPEPATERGRARRFRGVPAVLFLLLLFGGFAGLGIGFVVHNELTRAVFATESAAVPGTVVGVEYGEPVVSFSTRAGERYEKELPGPFAHGDPREVVVLYLVDAPQRAVLEGHVWPPWFLVAVVLALVTGGYLYFGDGGLRSGRHRRRREAHESGRSSVAGGTPGPGRAVWFPVGLFAAPAVLALAASVGLYTGPFTAVGTVELVSTSELYVWFVPATVLASFGAVLAGKALLRYAELAPAPHAPDPIRLLPADSEFVALLGLVLAGFLALPVGFGVHTVRDQIALADSTTAEMPVAEVTRSNGRGGCTGWVHVEYEADGLPYRERIEIACSDGEEYETAETVRVEWSRVRPSVLRFARE
ncbi:hypothetical protein ACWFMI_08030 [Nocardiopsis terrae]